MHAVHAACGVPWGAFGSSTELYNNKACLFINFSAKTCQAQLCRVREFLDHEFANLKDRKIAKRKQTVFGRNKTIFEGGFLFSEFGRIASRRTAAARLILEPKKRFTFVGKMTN